MRGVACPAVPAVESKVTKVMPVLSLLIPLVSDGSGAYVPEFNEKLSICAVCRTLRAETHRRWGDWPLASSSRRSWCSSTGRARSGRRRTGCCCCAGRPRVSALADESNWSFKRWNVRTSPTPRPGMFPPTLNGSVVSSNVLPWSVDTKIVPLFGSQKFVYSPTAYAPISRTTPY